MQSVSITSLQLLFVFLCVFGVFFSAAAQIPTGGTEARIVLEPAYPEPHAVVTAKIDAYTFDTNGASIAWFVDGIERSTAANTRELSLTTGPRGVETTITANITLASGQIVRATQKIVPSRTDIIIEADTLTPSFYRGRALPSSGSTVRAIAVTDADTPPQSLSYTWTLNGDVLYGGPLLGKQVADFTLQNSNETFLTVEITDRLGNTIGRRVVEIPIVEPEIRFYEDNPLRGTSKIVLASPHLLVGDEITVRAEPYFMSSNIFNDNPLIEWDINGRSTENPSEDLQAITLRSGGGSGNFVVDFHIRNLTDLLQGGRGAFEIAF